MKQLEDSQLISFDKEFVNDRRWDMVREQIDKDLPDGDFRFLDIGGGNGRFADRLLAAYPNATGTVLDNAEVLLEKNQPNERKTLVYGSVENLDRLDTKYDLVHLNWLLHHLVGDSYRQTRTNILRAAGAAARLLSPRGRLSIFECLYNGFLFDNLPSHLIFHLTSSRTLADIMRRCGANTAGVGVCFLSRKEWFATMKQAGLEIRSFVPDEDWPLPLARRVFLLIDHVSAGHFWLANRDPSPPAGVAG
jgi:SAM-dependent methyltransferase